MPGSGYPSGGHFMYTLGQGPVWVSSSGVVYLINDVFTAGGVNSTPGPGTRTTIDTGSRISITGGAVVFSGGGTWGDPAFGISAPGIVRTSGQLVMAKMTPTIAASRLFCLATNNTTFALSTWVAGIGTNLAASLSTWDAYTPANILLAPCTNGTEYPFCLALRHYGFHAFAQISGSWLLLYSYEKGESTPLYPVFGYDSMSVKNIRVPSTTYLPSPIVSTTFRYTTWGTSLGTKIVGIGDSRMRGAGAEIKEVEAATPFPTSDTRNFIQQLRKMLPVDNVVNKGVDGNTTTQIVARFATDCVALSPSTCIINGGVNDVGAGGSRATFLANYTTMLDACVAAGIKPIIMAILPWTDSSTAQARTIDDWNVQLASLVATYPTAIFVNATTAIGKFRTDGDEGNLWDVQALYNWDNLHLTAQGYDAVAGVIAQTLTPSGTSTTTNGLGHQEGILGGLGAGGSAVAMTTRLGTVAAVNGKLKATTLGGAGNDRAIVTMPLNTAYAWVQARLVKGTTGCGIVLHYTDANNYVYCWHNGTNLITVQRLAGTETTKITPSPAVAYGHSYIAELCAEAATTMSSYYRKDRVGTANTFDATLNAQNCGIIFFDTDSTVTDVAAYARGVEGQYNYLSRF